MNEEVKPELTPTLETIQAEQIISQQTRINELEKQRQDVLTELSNYIIELVSIRCWGKILIMNVVDEVIRICRTAYGVPPEYSLKIHTNKEDGTLNCVETVVNDMTREEGEEDKTEKTTCTLDRLCKSCRFFRCLYNDGIGYCLKKSELVDENNKACEELE